MAAGGDGPTVTSRLAKNAPASTVTSKSTATSGVTETVTTAETEGGGESGEEETFGHGGDTTPRGAPRGESGVPRDEEGGSDEGGGEEGRGERGGIQNASEEGGVAEEGGRGGGEGELSTGTHHSGQWREGGGGTEGMRGWGGRSRRSLVPERRAVLKRALSALWEDEEGGGGADGVGGGDKDGKGEGKGSTRSAEMSEGVSTEGSDEGERASRRHYTGGIKAFELSATIYGTRDSSPIPHRHGDGKGEGGESGGRDGVDLGFPVRREADWKHGFHCSDADLEEILLELEGEELEARERAKGTGERK